LESAKECVTTHPPNGPAPKMDDAEAVGRWFAGVDIHTDFVTDSRRRVGRRGTRAEAGRREPSCDRET